MLVNIVRISIWTLGIQSSAAPNSRFFSKTNRCRATASYNRWLRDEIQILKAKWVQNYFVDRAFRFIVLAGIFEHKRHIRNNIHPSRITVSLKTLLNPLKIHWLLDYLVVVRIFLHKQYLSRNKYNNFREKLVEAGTNTNLLSWQFNKGTSEFSAVGIGSVTDHAVQSPHLLLMWGKSKTRKNHLTSSILIIRLKKLQ